MKGREKMSRRKCVAGILVAVGVVMLSVPVYFHFHGKIKTDEVTQRFEHMLEEKDDEKKETKEKGDDKNHEAETTTNDEKTTLYPEGEAIAILEIESIGIRYPVVEGCSAVELNYAIGHMSETAVVGEKGNCVLAGHNGSRNGVFFTHLNQVKVGDKVTLLDRNRTYHNYEVTDRFVVGPYDNSIRTQGENEELTLFTCAEKGKKRFVVKCRPIQ